MPRSPSIIPEDTDRDVYFVLEDLGFLGQIWRETNDAHADRVTLIRDLLDGQFDEPARIVAFNTAQGWSRDVTDEIAAELAQACADRDETPRWIEDFIADHTQPGRVR
jgi:hypothetical protein